MIYNPYSRKSISDYFQREPSQLNPVSCIVSRIMPQVAPSSPSVTKQNLTKKVQKNRYHYRFNKEYFDKISVSLEYILIYKVFSGSKRREYNITITIHQTSCKGKKQMTDFHNKFNPQFLTKIIKKQDPNRDGTTLTMTKAQYQLTMYKFYQRI